MNAPQFSSTYIGAKAPTLYKPRIRRQKENSFPFSPEPLEVILSFESLPSSTDTSMFYRNPIGYSILPLNSPTKGKIV